MITAEDWPHLYPADSNTELPDLGTPVIELTYPNDVCHIPAISTESNFVFAIGNYASMEDKTMAHFKKIEFEGPEDCEQFQMMAFSVSCATCERSDEECPWHRRGEDASLHGEAQPEALEAFAA
ncbi:MAG: hypothetical protein WBV69_24660 [Candidatus Sulfotelmatobacter sp.]